MGYLHMQIHSLLPRLYKPSVYQGKRDPRKYFEGWYFKIVDPGGKQIWSFIPGISYSTDPHCFVQVIHANSGNTYYQRYPLSSFSFERKEFLIRVGNSTFSSSGISLDIEMEGFSVKGDLWFDRIHPYPSSLLAPGIMGWYSYVPLMECYHGVVSMQHVLSGSLLINDRPVPYHQGKGYTEKDWGRSMPSDWIWVQSNHFDGNSGASFMISLARIPWLRSFFPGFLSFLLLDGKVYRFATYNRSSIRKLEVDDLYVDMEVVNRKYTLSCRVLRKDGGILKAPRHGSMDRDIKESIVSTLNLELRKRNGELVFKDTGRFAGLEIVGDVAQYFRNND
jgi:hypothetical protein